MGTRSITYVILDGDFRLGQYKQLDGYPEALGVELLEFLTRTNRKLLRKKFDLCRPFYPSLVEVYDRVEEAKLINFEFDPENGSPNFSPVDHLERLFNCRAGAIIKVPIDSFVEFDKHNHSDILFIYIINLDSWRFEVLDAGGIAADYIIIGSYDLDELPFRSDFMRDYYRYLDVMEGVPRGNYRRYIYPEDREPFDKLMEEISRKAA